MKNSTSILRDVIVTIVILCLCFAMCLLIQGIFKAENLVASIFVLGTFIISVITSGYTYGIISALLGVLAVNFAFTFPYFKLNFTIPENLFSAIILIIIAIMTGTLTTKIKHQESIKAESERERIRGNLLRGISHDLRTPLTTIYASSSALLENKCDFNEKQKDKIIEGIKQDAEWLSRMVENLLSITKLDTGKVKIIKSPTVLDEFVDSVLIKFNKRYPEQEVLVEIPNEFVVIPMDALLIEQVALNILDNAMQHAKGMTKLTFKVFVSPDRAIFQIKDNGCGMPNEKIKSLFTGYYLHDDESYDSKKANAGIGLSVCSTIIKAHGGEINAENLRHGGMVFRFVLDMEDADE